MQKIFQVQFQLDHNPSQRNSAITTGSKVVLPSCRKSQKFEYRCRKSQNLFWRICRKSHNLPVRPGRSFNVVLVKPVKDV